VQNASADVNVLDDYEEGTWTPAIGGSGGQSGQVYSAQTGTYVKVGKHVTAWGRIALSTLDTVTGDVRITGLPFTAGSATNPGTVHFGYYGNFTANIVDVTGIVVASQTYITLYHTEAAATGLAVMNQADFANNTELYFTATYMAAA
jgi:hypothetical protein